MVHLTYKTEWGRIISGGDMDIDLLMKAPMTVSEFRKKVKTDYPHIKISIKTASFSDLARAEKKCLTVEGDREGELAQINEWAQEAGIIRDTNIRFFPKITHKEKIK